MNAARVAIGLFWLAMTGWLIRYEAFPRWFSGAAPDYRALFQEGPVIRDSWMRIEFQGTPIGYSHTWVDSDVASVMAATALHNQTELSLNVMGREQRLQVLISAVLDAENRLQRFLAIALAAGTETRLEGRRTHGDTFEVRIRAGESRQILTLALPDDVLIYSPATEMALAGLQPGQSLTARVLDPLTVSVSDLRLEALRREGESVVIRTYYQGMESLAWLDNQGQMLRQETPMGWTLARCTAEEALAIRPGSASAADLITALAVPCRGVSGNLTGAQSLTVRLKGASVDTQALASARQTIAGLDGGDLRLILAAQAEPRRTAPIGVFPESARPWLASTAAVPADHPVLRRKAQAILGAETNAWAAARLLNQWVHGNLVQEPTVSLPAALDVLERGAGDCNEHTILFVALARAAGIPARFHAGLVYAALPGRPGAFYYHAWPSVFVGEWVEMDPTHGLDRVGASHLAVTEGELSSQLGLLGLIGKASIDILDREPHKE